MQPAARRAAFKPAGIPLEDRPTYASGVLALGPPLTALFARAFSRHRLAACTGGETALAALGVASMFAPDLGASGAWAGRVVPLAVPVASR